MGDYDYIYRLIFAATVTAVLLAVGAGVWIGSCL